MSDPLDDFGDPLDDFGEPPQDEYGDVIDFDPRAAHVAEHKAHERYNFGNPTALDDAEELPTILKRTDGQALLYPGTVNLFAGEPGSCKSWLAQYECARIANSGAHVLYLDYESSYRSVMRRLTACGLRDDARGRIQYPKRLGRLSIPDIDLLGEYARELDITFIVIDGIAEALAAHQLTEDKAGEYAQWHAFVPRTLSKWAGAAVLLLDHVPKPTASRTNNGPPDLYPRGSGHKLAAIDGAAYMLSMVEPLSRANPGTVDLTIAKDREGYVGPKRWRAARVELTPIDHGRELDITVNPPPYHGRPPVEDEARVKSIDAKLSDDFCRDVLDAVTAASRRDKSPVTTRTIVDELRVRDVKFADKLVTPALIRLVDRGDLEATTGARRARLYAPPPKQTTLGE